MSQHYINIIGLALRVSLCEPFGLTTPVYYRKIQNTENRFVIQKMQCNTIILLINISSY